MVDVRESGRQLRARADGSPRWGSASRARRTRCGRPAA